MPLVMKYLSLCRSHPLAAVLSTALAILLLQICIDAYLGDIAEHFNAWYVVRATAAVGTGQPLPDITFIAGQVGLGIWSLPLALLLLLLLPLILGAGIVFAVRLWLRN